MSKTLDNLTDDRLSELLALEARVKDDALALAQRDAENARLRGALERIASSGGQELFPSHAFICRFCGEEWDRGEPESHAPDCPSTLAIAALAAKGTT